MEATQAGRQSAWAVSVFLSGSCGWLQRGGCWVGALGCLSVWVRMRRNCPGKWTHRKHRGRAAHDVTARRHGLRRCTLLRRQLGQRPRQPHPRRRRRQQLLAPCVREPTRVSAPPHPVNRRCRRPLEGLLRRKWRQALAEHRQATHRTHATAMATATYALHPAGEGSFGSPIGFLVGAVVRRTRTLRVAVHRALVPIGLRLRRLLPHEGAPHALSHLL